MDPCNPSPCGPNSICREVNKHAVCSCKTGFIGTPPSCRPECLISSECALDKACVTQKCVDPCPGTCGENARCQVVTHNPICSCSPGYTGDPFNRCTKIICKLIVCKDFTCIFLVMGFLSFTSWSFVSVACKPIFSSLTVFQRRHFRRHHKIRAYRLLADRTPCVEL